MSKLDKIGVGTLIVAISATIIYISMLGVKIRVDNDKATFYVKETWWTVAGREYISIFDGTSKMNRRLAGINITTDIDDINETVKITRTTPYIRGPVINDIYFFDGKIDDIEKFPIYHRVEVINASGYFFRYEVRDLTYSGDTYKLTDEIELSFGKNMKLVLNPNYRWAWVYKSGIVRAQYDINSDYEVFYFRLFDPVITLYLNGSSVDRFYEHGDPINATATTDSGSACLSLDAYGYGDNYTCGVGSVEINFDSFTNQIKFYDNSYFKNITSNQTVNITFHNESINLISAKWNFTGYSSGEVGYYDNIGLSNYNPHGMTSDGNYIWVVDDGINKYIYKYDMEGNYISNFQVGSYAKGVAQNGTHFFYK